MTEFAASNHINASIGMTAFFANYDFQPRTDIKPSGMYKRERQAELLMADKIICRQEEMIAFLQDQLAWLQDKQTQFANKTCQPYPKYKVGDSVYVDARHFVSEKDKKLLNLKNTGHKKRKTVENCSKYQ